jgi:hypothetical protein
LERLGKALHARHDKIANEPLPERWVDLIHYLDDKERQQAEPPKRESQKPRTKD